MKHYSCLNEWLKQQNIECYTVKQGKYSKHYYNIYAGFDIETTTYLDRAYMYIWQLGINGQAFYGNTWEEYNDCLEILNNYIIRLNAQKCAENHSKEFKAQMLCFIHNISFEWQFVRKEIPITDVFLKSLREPLYFESNNIKFIDSYQITHMSLAKLAKRYTKTQKMVGDIDYMILRNSFDGKNLTEKEQKYCENDVLILCEFAEYYFNKYIKNNEMIYTETSIVRHRLKQAFKEQKKITKNQILGMYPKTFNEYLMYMEYLFTGGWVKSAADVYGKILHDIKCKDITSSYPAQISHRYYPVSEFKKVSITGKSQFNHLLGRYCCILDLTLYNVKKTTIHSIISTSKIINNDNGRVLVDNGRIAEADKVRLLMTELDWEIFNKFYKHDIYRMECNSFKIAVRGKLPDYVVSTMLDAYERKEELKLAGEDYYNEKCFVNMFYGCFVTRIHKYNYTMDTETGNITKELNDYYKNIRSSVLSPFWGIWCTAWARWQELTAVYENADCVVYGDTDSVKGYNMPDDYFNKYNKEQIEKNKKLAEKYNKNYELIKELGCWDSEPTYRLFKTIGCKRYIGYDENNKLSVTIAGVPKGTLEREARIKTDDKNHTSEPEALLVMELLKDGQIFEDCKTSAIYNDIEHSDYINGELMTSKSSIAITNIDFTIKVKKEYTDYIEQIIDMYEREIR